MEDSDEALVTRYQRGDVAAFEALLDRHHRPVFRFLRRFVGEDARADDLAQECWLRFVGAAPRWREGGRFRTWLYAVARNLATDDARRAAHRAAQPLTDSLLGEAPGGSQDGAGSGSDVLLRGALERAVTALPPEQREVFLLREIEGLPFADVAEVTGAPLPTVKSRMRYALAALQRALDEAPPDAGRPGARSAGR